MGDNCGSFSVQKALVPINGEIRERFFILKDDLPFNQANFFLDSKSIRSINTGRQYAYYLCRFLNYISECGKTYKQATNLDVERFIDFVIFGIPEQNVYSMKGTVTYSTVNEYIVTVTGFYQSLDILTQKETNMVLYQGTTSKGIEHRYLYGQIWQADYVEIVDKRVRLLKDSKEKIRWLKEDQINAISDNFNTLRDRVIFMILVFCGTRIGEALSIMYQDYQINRRSGTNTVTPYKSKGKRDGEGRDIVLPEVICEMIDSYIFTERNAAEAQSREFFTEELFVTLRGGEYQSRALSYASYYGVFKRTVERAGLDSELFTTHDGRRTKVMSLLKYQSETGEITDEMIRQIMGWRSPSTINKYKNNKDKEYIKGITSKLPGFDTAQ